MKTALVHDYFTQLGGAERVAETLSWVLPDPDLFATVTTPEGIPESLRSVNIKTSWMQHLPGMKRYYRHFFPLYPFGVSSLNLSGYDLVVSSSSGYAKGVRVDNRAVHVCYCHTPMRWVWRYNDYAAREKFGLLQRIALPMLISGLRHWDEGAARQPDQYVVNSQVVAERVWSAYRRHAVVIPPPINVERFRMGAQQDDFYLVLSRLVSYKRIDLAVEACTRLKRRLVVIGQGPDRERLERMAGPTVQFLGRQPDAVVESYVGRCRALLFPGEEDFGMVPLEVNAAGRPVVAFGKGGALETVIEGITGLFFSTATSDSLAGAIEELEHRSWNQAAIRCHAEGFSADVFERRFMGELSRLVPGIEVRRNDRKSPVAAGSANRLTALPHARRVES
jgi:glycosyltransferase involved in cell wall biosynthesis